MRVMADAAAVFRNTFIVWRRREGDPILRVVRFLDAPDARRMAARALVAGAMREAVRRVVVTDRGRRA